MLTEEKDPKQVNLHQVIFSLVLSRSGRWHLNKQLRTLIDSISFLLEPGFIQESEFRYLTHLMY